MNLFLDDEHRALIQRALNYVRVADTEKTPALIISIPQIQHVNAEGRARVETQTFLYGEPQIIEQMLTSIIKALMQRGEIELLERATASVAMEVAREEAKVAAIKEIQNA